MTLRGGLGGPALSVTMTSIFPKIVWTCPLKGLSTRKKLQNSKGYTESPEFLPEFNYFGKKSVATNLRQIRSLIRSITIFLYIYMYNYIIRTNSITLPCSLARAGN